MSRHGSTRWPARLCVVLGFVAASTVALPPVTAAPFTITLELDRPAFSPNGDGRADVLAGDLYLLRRASVRLLVVLGKKFPTGTAVTDHETVSPWVRPPASDLTSDRVTWGGSASR